MRRGDVIAEGGPWFGGDLVRNAPCRIEDRADVTRVYSSNGSLCEGDDRLG